MTKQQALLRLDALKSVVEKLPDDADIVDATARYGWDNRTNDGHPLVQLFDHGDVLNKLAMSEAAPVMCERERGQFRCFCFINGVEIMRYA